MKKKKKEQEQRTRIQIVQKTGWTRNIETPTGDIHNHCLHSTLQTHYVRRTFTPCILICTSCLLYILSPGSNSIATIINIEINTMILVYFALPASSFHPFACLVRCAICTIVQWMMCNPIWNQYYGAFTNFFYGHFVCVCMQCMYTIQFRISKRVQHNTGRAKRVCMRAIHVILKPLRGALQLYTIYSMGTEIRANERTSMPGKEEEQERKRKIGLCARSISVANEQTML